MKDSVPSSAPSFLARLLPESACTAETFTDAADNVAECWPVAVMGDDPLPPERPHRQHLPSNTERAAVQGDTQSEQLFPQEQELIARAVDRRRREFTTTRLCARRALHQLGWPPAPLLRGERGEPLWPPGVVGSLTHCAGYRAAAVARQTDLAGIGIDAEPVGPLPAGVLQQVARPEELARLAKLSATSPVVRPGAVGPPDTCHPATNPSLPGATSPASTFDSWDHLLFSAKESIYKVWYPLTGLWLGFKDVRLNLQPDGRFNVDFLVPVPEPAAGLHQLQGRWLSEHGLILTAAVVPI